MKLAKKARWWLGRLHVQFTLYIALLLVTFTVLVLASNWRGQQEIVLDRLAAHVDYVADLTAIFAADRLAVNDRAGLTDIVDRIIDQERAASIAIVLDRGELIVAAQGEEAFPPDSETVSIDTVEVTGERMHADAEIIVDGERVGIVHVDRALVVPGQVSGSIIGNAAFGDEAASVRGILVRNLLIGLGLFLLAIPAAALMARRVTRGISAVTRAATRAADGDLDGELSRSGSGEVQELQQAFGRMQASLRQNITHIEKLAYRDTVTDLDNRPRFDARLREIAHDDVTDTGAVILIDLDHFQGINDTFGHAVGDDVLRGVAQRLATTLATARAREEFIGESVIARLGGDEFAVLVTGNVTPHSAEQLVLLIVNAIDEPFHTDDLRLNLSCSIGVTLFRRSNNPAEILKEADLALFDAKQSGRRGVRFYSEALGAEAQRRTEIEIELRDAIRTGEISVCYQPLIRCDTLAVTGAEALARWHRPGKGNVSPSEFIPIAEESGLIVEIGNLVLRRSLRDLRTLLDRGITMSVAVNASAAQLHRAGFADNVIAALEEARVPPHLLEIELTETVLVQLSDQPDREMHRLRAIGVRFAIDDFGTGHSNLSRLPKLPFDTLKIDQSFIAGIATAPEQQTIVRAVVSLAKSLGLSIVAEGVESEQDFFFLHDLKVDTAQGFLWSPALPFAQFAELVEALAKPTAAFSDGDRLRA